MKGVGEKIMPFDLPFLWYLIVYPDVVLSTRDVYNGLRIVLTKGKNEVTFSGNFTSTLDIADILENDLEEVAFFRCPKIKTIKEALRDAGAVGALMSGSGSAVFGIFEQQDGAQEALEKVRDFGSVFIAHSV
jgi:4-diphosphocytidyl-2-C-methyl-D-erythritol kinase